MINFPMNEQYPDIQNQYFPAETLNKFDKGINMFSKIDVIPAYTLLSGLALLFDTIQH